MKRLLLILALAFVAWSGQGARPAHAACTLLLLVGQCTCEISATDMSFGEYDPTSPTADTTTSNVTVVCTPFVAGVLVSYDVKLSAGNGTYANRRMNGPSGSYISYQIYREQSYSTIWGNGAGGSGTSKVTLSHTLSVLAPFTDVVTAYGRILPGQNVRAGDYSDTIIVTVEY